MKKEKLALKVCVNCGRYFITPADKCGEFAKPCEHCKKTGNV